MKKIIFCLFFTLLLLTSCGISEYNSSETTVDSEKTTEADTNTVDVSNTSSYAETEKSNEIQLLDGISVTVYPVDAYSAEKLSISDFSEIPLSIDMDNGDAEPTKEFEYNGKTVSLKYDKSIKRRYSDSIENIYTYENEQEQDNCFVILYDNGNISAISGTVLGELSGDLTDEKKIRIELENAFAGNGMDFSKFDSHAFEKYGHFIQISWYNDICGSVSYERIEIKITDEGKITSLSNYIMPENVFKYKPYITEEQLELVVEAEKNKLLEKAGMGVAKVNGVEYKHLEKYYISYEGKPAFVFNTNIYGCYPDDEKHFETLNVDFLIVIDESSVE